MKITDVLTAEEIARVTRRSDLHGAWIVLLQWLQIAAIFWAVAMWTNPFTFIVGTLLLGGRMLGFGVINHECGHGTLFRSRRLNEVVGDWLSAPPGFSNIPQYMRGHLKHHQLAGTPDDPDLGNYRDYPIARSRLRRKVWRDISGQTGWRTVKSIGRAIRRLPSLPAQARATLLRGLGFQVLLIAVLAASGNVLLYGMWVIAFMCINPLVSRIRQVAEHAAVPDQFDADPRRNTRTVRANWLERMFFAPHQVNYHLEHHLLASVPAYRLKGLHELLRRKGFYDDVDFPRGYADLLRKVTAPAA